MEQIYTIPINEVFDTVTAEGGPCLCPLCLLEGRLDESETDLILGASMMEPDIRIKTNEQGFCRTHYTKMLGMKNRLGLALMLESHLDEVKRRFKPAPLSALFGKKQKRSMDTMGAMGSSCYICGKVRFHMTRSYLNLMEMYAKEEDFRRKYESAPLFCIPHTLALCEEAEKSFTGKSLDAFREVTLSVARSYMDSLRDDVSHFCKKFDYRYEDEPWGNAKDAPVRAAAFLTGASGGEKFK